MLLAALFAGACFFLNLPWRPSGPPTIIPYETAARTPTGVYSAHTAHTGMGGCHWLVTREAVGDLPALTRVRISHAWLEDAGWWCCGVAEDETRFAEVREDQLAYLPGIEPGQPTPAG